MFTIVLLFVMVKNWKQPKCSKIGDWLNTVNYYDGIPHETLGTMLEKSI